MKEFASITIHPEVQDGAPVFSGTRIRVETFFDYMRSESVSTNSLTNSRLLPDQAMEVYSLIQSHYALAQIASMITGPQFGRRRSVKVVSSQQPDFRDSGYGLQDVCPARIP
jgi:hypothetical protein